MAISASPLARVASLAWATTLLATGVAVLEPTVPTLEAGVEDELEEVEPVEVLVEAAAAPVVEDVKVVVVP